MRKTHLPIIKDLLSKGFKLVTVFKALVIPKSTYFDWTHYQEPTRQREDAILTELLLEIWQKNYRAYGAPRLKIALANLHLHQGIKRIRHLMKAADIYSVMVKRFQQPTMTVDYKQRPNLIKHLTSVNAWSMDITYLKLTDEHWLYLTSVLDLNTHKILAHQISATMNTKLVVSTLQRALSQHAKPDYLHTDMDSQFTSFGFEQVLQQAIAHSYSKLGHLYDNAKIESFHSLLKREMIYQFHFASLAHLILAVSTYLDWYNDERISVVHCKMQVA